jgi:catechol 2,3-dioxygenase-like lactoylglutathione lyase family enzyme
MDVLGLDHVDLRVTNLERSTRFYDRILGALGFSRVVHPSYVAWSNGKMNIGLRHVMGAKEETVPLERRPGLHHLALRVRARQHVDQFYAFLQSQDVVILDAPAAYPQYRPDYYAVFFADPDGLKLELVHFPWGYWRRVQTDGVDERPRYAPERFG